MFIHAHFSERVRKRSPQDGRRLGFLRAPMISPPFWRDGGLQPTNLGLSVQGTGLRSLSRRAANGVYTVKWIDGPQD